MTNSDYILRAAIKKVTEKLNDLLVDKIEEATNIAQDVPEMIKKEIETLKESIIEEAQRMEKETIKTNETSKSFQDQNIEIALEEIKVINKQIEEFNNKMNKFF